jgi:ABC-type glycerol-3-phosphate transport system permease component
MNYVARGRLRRAVDGIVLFLVAATALFPILWGLSTSLKPVAKIMEYPPQLVPRPPTFEHYRQLFDAGIALNIFNSLLVSFLTVVVSLVIGSLGAYALARFDFFGKKIVMFMVISVMSIPLVSLMVPSYTFLFNLGLLDSRTGLVLLYTAYQLPVTVWVLYAFFTTLPLELERAAMIDGYSRLEALRRIVIPLSKPGMVAAGLLIVVFAWNDFVVALTMTASESVRTLPVAIYNYLGYYGREWGPLTAGAMVSIIPIIVVFIAFQRYFLSGMTGGSVKG